MTFAKEDLADSEDENSNSDALNANAYVVDQGDHYQGGRRHVFVFGQAGHFEKEGS